MLKDWLLSYHPEELFDEDGKLIPELKALAPTGDRRIGSNPHANGVNYCAICVCLILKIMLWMFQSRVLWKRRI